LVDSTSRNVPAIIETAAAMAPVAPASKTIELLVVLLATPKTSPKIETVPSYMPKTISPMELVKDFPMRCQSELPAVLCFVGGLFLSGVSFAESMIHVPLFVFFIG
jgi:hypothetical protein